MAEYQPFVNLGPGDSIKEELAYYGWDQKALAEILDKTEKHISSLLNNKTVITFDMACQLSAVFKQSPEYWLNLDAQYRLRLQEDANNGETAAKLTADTIIKMKHNFFTSLFTLHSQNRQDTRHFCRVSCHKLIKL